MPDAAAFGAGSGNPERGSRGAGPTETPGPQRRTHREGLVVQAPHGEAVVSGVHGARQHLVQVHGKSATPARRPLPLGHPSTRGRWRRRWHILRGGASRGGRGTNEQRPLTPASPPARALPARPLTGRAAPDLARPPSVGVTGTVTARRQRHDPASLGLSPPPSRLGRPATRHTRREATGGPCLRMCGQPAPRGAGRGGGGAAVREGRGGGRGPASALAVLSYAWSLWRAVVNCSSEVNLTFLLQ